MRNLLRRLIVWALTAEQPKHDAAALDAEARRIRYGG